MENSTMENKTPVPQEQLQPETINPYENSEIVTSLLEDYQAGKELKIAYLDVDSTLTSEKEDLDEAIKEQEKARQLLEEAGYQIVFVSSRPLEMMVSREQAHLSEKYGFNRPHPKFKKVGVTTVGNIDSNRDKGFHHELAYPDDVPYYAGIINPVAALSGTGTEIWIQQNGENGYALDQEFEDSLGVDRATWRSQTMAKVDAANQKIGGKMKYALIEDIQNLNDGKIDVGPLDLRVQVNTVSQEPSALDDQLAFMDEMKQHTDLRILEDGNPLSKPIRNQMYIMPEKAGKEHCINAFFDGIMETMNEKLAQTGKQVKPSDFKSLFIGDSLPDIHMGLYGAPGSEATILYIGGSRLTNYIGNQFKDQQQFHSENFTDINKLIQPKSEKGFYQYKDRTIIVGDEVYPGTKTTETIIEYLESKK